MKLLLTLTLSLCAASAAIASDPLGDLKGKYETAKAGIEATQNTAERQALASYGKTLDAYLAHFKKQGDIDNYTAVNAEKVRFSASNTVLAPDSVKDAYVKQAALAYEQAVAKAKTDADTAHASLLKRYIPALERLIKQQMAANKMQDAKATKEEVDRVQFILAEIESRQPKPEPVEAKPEQAEKLSFRDMEPKDMVGKYVRYLNGARLGYMLIHPDGKATDQRGVKDYRWSLEEDRFVIYWGKTKTVLTDVVKKGEYTGEQPNRQERVVKVPGIVR